MGPIRGRQDPGGPHVGPMNFSIWCEKDINIRSGDCFITWRHQTLTWTHRSMTPKSLMMTTPSCIYIYIHIYIFEGVPLWVSNIFSTVNLVSCPLHPWFIYYIYPSSNLTKQEPHGIIFQDIVFIKSSWNQMDIMMTRERLFGACRIRSGQRGTPSTIYLDAMDYSAWGTWMSYSYAWNNFD